MLIDAHRLRPILGTLRRALSQLAEPPSTEVWVVFSHEAGKIRPVFLGKDFALFSWVSIVNSRGFLNATVVVVSVCS